MALTSDDFANLKNSVDELTKAVTNLLGAIGKPGSSVSGGGAGGALGSAPIGGGSQTGGGQALSAGAGGGGLASIGRALSGFSQASPVLGEAIGGARSIAAAGAALGPVGFGVAALGVAVGAAASGNAAEKTASAYDEAIAGAVGLTHGQALAKAARAEARERYEIREKDLLEGTLGMRMDPQTGEVFETSLGRPGKQARDRAYAISNLEQEDATAYEREFQAEQRARAKTDSLFSRSIMYGHLNEQGYARNYEFNLRNERRIANSTSVIDRIVDHTNSLPNLDRIKAGVQGNAAKKAHGS